MLKKLLVALLGLFLSLALGAQTHKVTLQLQDDTTGEAVGFATVSLQPEKGQAKYTLSDNEGHAVLDKVRSGKYTLKAEIMGYKTYEKSITLQADLNLGVVKMEQDRQVLDAASVSAVGNPIIIKKDTIEYNASSFKISDDNMLVDLLKKLPGIEVSEDGTITSNGETISKITIAGKTFFLDDPQLATQNIPAKLVEKVKVVKKKSEQAEFTGIDDGNDETVIDLTVQKGMMNGLFGNLTAGGGHDVPSSSSSLINDWRWQGGGMLGRFTEKDQISLILNANNTNNRSFNDLAGGMMGNMMGGGGMMGRGGGFGGFGNSNGINTSWMVGLNGNTEFFDGKMDAGGNYVYNGSVIDVLEETDKETYQTESSTLYSHEDGKSHRFTNGHRFGLRIEHKFSENTSLLIQPQVNFGGGSYVQQSVFNSAMNTADNKINDGFTNNTGDNKNVTTSGFMLLRQRLGIPGRTISLNATWNISSNKMEGLNQSLTNTYEDNVLKDATPVNQLIEQNSQSQSLGGRLVYTEPLGGNFYLEGSYNVNWSNSESTKDAYNHDGDYAYSGSPYSLETISMEYNVKGEKDPTYSNKVINRNLNQNVGVAFMYQEENIRAQLGASAIHTNTYNETSSNLEPYQDKRWNFAPRAMLFADFNENANVRLFYNGRSAQPSTSQLNPVLDNSNPLLLSLGNPHLNPYFSHNFRNEWEYSNKQTFFTARLNLQGGMVQNPIVNAVWYNGGRQYSMPVNGENSYNASARLMINAPIAKSNFSISNTSNISYSKSGSYLANDSFQWRDYFDKDATTGELTDNFQYDAFYKDYYEDKTRSWDTDFRANTTRSLTVMENLRATYRNDYVEVIVGARTRVSKPWYTVQDAVSATWNNRVSGSFKWTVGETGMEISTDAAYNWYRGYTTEQPSQLVWNASISKQIFKKQATVALKAYDILDQATNLTVTDTANYHSEVRNNTLGRYIMLTFTWRFGTFGGNRRGGMGGPGGFRGGPPMGGGGFRPF